MNLMWFEIRFSEVDLNRGRNKDLINETQKLYNILDHLEGIALYSGKYKKNIGKKYYLTIPDNDTGRNLTQYLKLKRYIPCEQPDRDELSFVCGSPLTADIYGNTSPVNFEIKISEPLTSKYIHPN